jgi:hypothetical protein
MAFDNVYILEYFETIVKNPNCINEFNKFTKCLLPFSSEYNSLCLLSEYVKIIICITTTLNVVMYGRETQSPTVEEYRIWNVLILMRTVELIRDAIIGGRRKYR